MLNSRLKYCKLVHNNWCTDEASSALEFPGEVGLCPLFYCQDTSYVREQGSPACIDFLHCLIFLWRVAGRSCSKLFRYISKFTLRRKASKSALPFCFMERGCKSLIYPLGIHCSSPSDIMFYESDKKRCRNNNDQQEALMNKLLKQKQWTGTWGNVLLWKQEKTSSVENRGPFPACFGIVLCTLDTDHNFCKSVL